MNERTGRGLFAQFDRSPQKESFDEEILTKTNPGSLLTSLLRLDGRIGTVVNAEKHVVDTAVVSGEVTEQLERIVRKMGLGAEDGVMEQPSIIHEFTSVKPSFTRATGSIRRKVSSQGVRDPGVSDQ